MGATCAVGAVAAIYRQKTQTTGMMAPLGSPQAKNRGGIGGDLGGSRGRHAPDLGEVSQCVGVAPGRVRDDALIPRTVVFVEKAHTPETML